MRQLLVSFVFVVLALSPSFARSEDQVLVRWKDQQKTTLEVLVTSRDEILDRCLDSGLEVRYRYELVLCRRRTAWFHDCKDDRQIIHSLQFDPVSQAYKLARDKLGDGMEPEATTLDDRASADKLLTMADNITIPYLAKKPIQLRPNSYVSVRVIADCRGPYSETLTRIGSILTLGLIQIGALNSGWVDFNLD